MTSGNERSGPRPETGAVRFADAKNVDESLLKLEDVAMLAGATDGGQLTDPTIRRLAAATRTDPRFSRHYEALSLLAREAGFEPMRDRDLETALDCHRNYQRLLDTDGWEHPSEVLDPDGEIGIPYRELAHIASAHSDRADGDSKIMEVREKLHRAWAAQRQMIAPVASFVARLLEHDGETAEALLKKATIEYRRQRRAGR